MVPQLNNGTLACVLKEKFQSSAANYEVVGVVITSYSIERQSPGGVLLKDFLQKIRKIHWKTLVLESLFHQIGRTDLQIYQ